VPVVFLAIPLPLAKTKGKKMANDRAGQACKGRGKDEGGGRRMDGPASLAPHVWLWFVVLRVALKIRELRRVRKQAGDKGAAGSDAHSWQGAEADCVEADSNSFSATLRCQAAQLAHSPAPTSAQLQPALVAPQLARSPACQSQLHCSSPSPPLSAA
jgi:hypothetical protein